MILKCRSLPFYFFLTVGLFSQDWKTVKTSNSNIIFEIDESSQGDFFHIRATTIIDLSISQISKFIESPNSYAQWLYRYKEAEIESKEGDSFSFRAIINAPLPLKNRRLKVLVRKKQNLATGEIEFKLQQVSFDLEDIYCPSCEDVEYLKGSWFLIPLKGKRARVIHEMETKVKAPLPRSIIYKLLQKGPVTSFENLQDFSLTYDK